MQQARSIARPVRARGQPCMRALAACARQPQAGINKLIRILEGENESQFTAEQYMQLYT